jgi:hypothetical protein
MGATADFEAVEFAEFDAPPKLTDGGAIAGLTVAATFAGILGVITVAFAGVFLPGRLVIFTTGWSIGAVLTGIGTVLLGTTIVVACPGIEEFAGLVLAGVFVCPGLTTRIIFLVVSCARKVNWQIITKNNASVIFSVIGLFILVINNCLSIKRILRY